jgi:hypothetical protein
MVKMDRRRRRLWPGILQWGLLIAGCTQIAGYLLDSQLLKGLGFSYCFGPLPTVFSTVEGVEGFDTKHAVIYQDAKGQTDSLPLDQAFFTAFRGHYYLKNAFSIFLAYPHVLKPEAVKDGLHFFLCRSQLQSANGTDLEMHNPGLLTRRLRDGKMEVILVSPPCSGQ